MARKPLEKPAVRPASPLALRDEDLAAVAGASFQAHIAIRGVKTGAGKGEVLIGVGTCSK